MLKNAYTNSLSFKPADMRRFWLVLFCMFFIAITAGRAVETNYIVPPGTPGVNPLPNYTNWATAATNIQDAINSSVAGNTIYITNGHYYLTGAIFVAKGVIIRSFNNGILDPANTIIDGNNYPGKPVTNKCLSITVAATIDGLTLTNGAADSSGGGGCYLSTGILTNCIITGNYATNGWFKGGGIFFQGGTIANCRIVGNSAPHDGGGIYMQFGGTIKNCLIGWNSSAGDFGGAISMHSGGSVFNCDIVSNYNQASSICFYEGTGMIVSNCTLRNNLAGFAVDCWNETLLTGPSLISDCRIINNIGGASYAGGVILSKGAKIRNSLIANNFCTNFSGGGVATHWNAGVTGFVESCTIVSNYAYSGGGISVPAICFITNTIIASNNAAVVAYKDLDIADSATNNFAYSSCPSRNLPSTQGNIQTDPMFVDFNASNYRLDGNSPSVNRGINQDWMTNAVDLDGRSRIDRFSGLADMGCFENIPSGTMVTIP